MSTSISKAARLIVLLACIAPWSLVGCSTFDGSSGGDRVWVAQVYSGGRQCAPAEDYAAPDTRAVLEDAGVRVFDTAVRPMAVCQACDCPAYSATHYAQIRATDLDLATQAGFERSDPPSAA